MRWALLLALLFCAACERRLLEVPAHVEWLAWVEMERDEVVSASPLFEVNDPRVWAIDPERIRFVGFAGIGDLVEGMTEWSKEPLIAATECDAQLLPVWPEDLELPRLTATWVRDRCSERPQTSVACAPCKCGLALREPLQLSFGEVETSAALLGVAQDGDTLYGTLRRYELDPADPAEYLAEIQLEGGLPRTQAPVRVPGISRSIAIQQGRIVVGSHGDVVKIEDGVVVERIPIPTGPPELEVVSGAGSVFVFAYHGRAYEITDVASEETLFSNDLYDLAIDAESGGVSVLGNPHIISCPSIGTCDWFKAPEDKYAGLSFSQRPRIASIDGVIYFGMKDEPVQRWDGFDWMPLSWPAQGSEPRVFVPFADGVLIGGHLGLTGGLVHFVRGAEQCTLPIEAGRVNDIVVRSIRSAFLVLDGVLGDQLVELVIE